MTNALKLLTAEKLPIHPATARFLSDLGEFSGKQELYTRQSVQRLSALVDKQYVQIAYFVVPMVLLGIYILLQE